MIILLGDMLLFFKFWRLVGNIQLVFHHFLGLLNYRNNSKNLWFLMYDGFDSRSVLNRLKVFLRTHTSVRQKMKCDGNQWETSSELCLRSLRLLSIVGESCGNSRS